MKQCKYCKQPVSSRATFCDDHCRHEFSKLVKNRELSEENKSMGQISMPFASPVQPNKPFATAMMNKPTKQSSHGDSSALEYMLKEKVSELKAFIEELKADKKLVDAELKTLTKEHSALELKHNTIKRDHEQELHGVEQNSKTIGKEFIDLLRDKDTMGNLIDVYAAIKGTPNAASVANVPIGESEDLQAIKGLYSKLGGEHQKMFINSLYVYGKRPDLLEKQALELEQIINGN